MNPGLKCQKCKKPAPESALKNQPLSEKLTKKLIDTQNDELLPDVRTIFEGWFDKYAKPKVEFPDANSLTDERYMDKQACVCFMTTISRQ